jgi:ATP adenylyltransferase
MVIPYNHVSSPEMLSAKELSDMALTLNRVIALCTKSLTPHGFNIGMNIGDAAGAGIKNHIHMHLVPRWNGDCNFMPVLAATKVIPQSLDELYSILIKKNK